MKRSIIYTVLALTAVISAGCSKFLDVNPRGETFDNDMFTSAEGYEDALYGIYSELSYNNSLYGGDFIWISEVMSQNTTALTDNTYGNLATANWTINGPTSLRKTLWSNAYKVINHINNIVKHAEAGGTNEFKHSKLYLGEALALRALVHFDLVRYFGPPFWASDDIKSKAIPYVKNYTFSVTDYSSLDGVYDQIIDDLTRAESLMGEDETLIPESRTNVANSFTEGRITHLNLYAVEALLARAYWSKGDIANAAIYAQKVIDSNKFTFRPLSSFVQSEGGVLDMHETIFGFYTVNSQKVACTKYGLTGTKTTFSLASDWNTLYEEGSGSNTDYRISAWFDSAEGHLKKTANINIGSGGSYSGSAIAGVNILRIPEMYYIMAEFYLTSNPRLAAEFYNKVVTTRGLDEIAEGKLTYDLLFNERRKEFYGEGFTWYEMKKLGKDIKTAAGTTLSGSVPGNYTVTIPDDEDDARNDMEI